MDSLSQPSSTWICDIAVKLVSDATFVREYKCMEDLFLQERFISKIIEKNKLSPTLMSLYDLKKVLENVNRLIAGTDLVDSADLIELLNATNSDIGINLSSKDFQKLKSEQFKSLNFDFKLANSPEDIMVPNNQIAVQSITYIFGVPEDQVSDAQIFERIASLELAMAELGKIKAKSSKISEKIAAYKSDIAALVAIVDARE